MDFLGGVCPRKGKLDCLGARTWLVVKSSIDLWRGGFLVLSVQGSFILNQILLKLKI